MNIAMDDVQWKRVTEVNIALYDVQWKRVY